MKISGHEGTRYEDYGNALNDLLLAKERLDACDDTPTAMDKLTTTELKYEADPPSDSDLSSNLYCLDDAIRAITRFGEDSDHAYRFVGNALVTLLKKMEPVYEHKYGGEYPATILTLSLDDKGRPNVYLGRITWEEPLDLDDDPPNPVIIEFL